MTLTLSRGPLSGSPSEQGNYTPGHVCFSHERLTVEVDGLAIAH